MIDLSEKLIAYASGQLDDHEAVEIEALLTRYADQQLAPAEADIVDRLMNSHPGVATIVNEALTGKQWFEDTLAPELHPILLKAEASPQNRNLVETLANRPSLEEKKIEKAPSRMPSLFGTRTQYALAASIVMALLIGGWSFSNVIRDRLESAQNTQSDLEQDLQQQRGEQEQQLAEIASLNERIEDYEQRLASVAAERASAQADLSDVSQELSTLQSERSELKARLTASERELSGMTPQIEENKRLRNVLDNAKAAERRTATANQHAIEELDDKIAGLESELKQTEDARQFAEELRTESELIVAALRTESLGQKDEMGELEGLAESRAAELEDRERQIVELTDQITDLDARLSEATTQIAALVAREKVLVSASERNLGIPTPNWTEQVAGYYRLYAKQSRRHLVEVRADERQHIEKWLGEQLGRPVLAPDLSHRISRR